MDRGRSHSKMILRKEIKRGVNVRHLRKAVLAGIAGSGKTTSLQVVIGETPPTEDERTSTPLLARPVKTEVIHVENQVHWKKTVPEEKKRYIINYLREKLREKNSYPDSALISTSSLSFTTAANPVRISFSMQHSSSTTDTYEVRDSTTNIPHRTPLTTTPAKGTLEYLLQSSELDQEYIYLLNNPIEDSEEEVLHEVEEVYMVDSGGQPEFMEAMAVFLGGASVCMLVIDLSQSLDEHPLIGYWTRGKPISKPYRCMRSNEQNLKRFIQTVNTFVSKTEGQQAKLLFLGTHRDKVDQSLPETVADKNARLKKLIPAKLKNLVIQLDKNNLIFEINALNPDERDRKTAEKIRSYILKQCPAQKMDIPVRWDALEDKLRSIAEGLGRQVMSREECWRVAQTVGLEEDSFEEALDFFHNWSLMFYFRDILKEVVFIDPQVILDKVSELVVLMFELQESEEIEEDIQKEMKEDKEEDAADILLPSGWQEFVTFAHVTRTLLEDHRFATHYKDGIFSHDHLIHLLQELLVLAKLQNKTKETWLMPSVLKQMKKEKMNEVCTSPGPLVVDFPDGGPQNGIFCSLTAHLLSPRNPHPCPWKLCLSDNTPKCLYRDCIKFTVPGYGSVTLVDNFKYFEVHISDTTSEEEEKELWQHVARALFSGIEQVSKLLSYSENNSRPAIICPKAGINNHEEIAHAAYINNYKWNCTCDTSIRGTLIQPDTQFHWSNEPCISAWVEQFDSQNSQITATNEQSQTLDFQSTGTSNNAPAVPEPNRTTPDDQTVTKPPTKTTTKTILDIDDHFDAMDEVSDIADRWKSLGAALRLPRPVLNRIEKDHPNDCSSCLEDVLTEWLKQSYNTERHGFPTWKMLVDAVAHRSGGNNHALANEIATKYHVSQ